MRYSTVLVIALVVFASVRIPAQTNRRTLQRPLPAPTYYIAVQARTCEPDLIQFDGATNLPPGSLVELNVRDFDGDSWRDYSHEIHETVGNTGLFSGEISPKQNAVFHNNLILVADFITYGPEQPGNVLRIVGQKGENLGGIDNPQVFQTSGWYYGLESIARVPPDCR